jgi:hypothetical protein
VSGMGASQDGTPSGSVRLAVLAFAAGFLAVLLFHQPMLAVLHSLGVTPATAYETRPVPPLGVPRVASAAFWGGMWGVVLALLAPWFPRGLGYWGSATLFGAAVVTLVAWFVVAPLKGLPVAGGGHSGAMATGLLVNGAWGFGVAVLFAAFQKMVGAPDGNRERPT